MFESLRGKAGLDELANDAKDGTKRYRLEFNHIRDGAYTHATRDGIPWEHAQVLAGHKTKMPNKYVK